MEIELSKKQIESMKYLKSKGGSIPQSEADSEIHYVVQYNLYVKLMISNIMGKNARMELTNRGVRVANSL